MEKFMTALRSAWLCPACGQPLTITAQGGYECQNCRTQPDVYSIDPCDRDWTRLMLAANGAQVVTLQSKGGMTQ